MSLGQEEIARVNTTPMQSINMADGANTRKNSMMMPNESPFTKMQIN